ncbi:Uncharacterised protein [Gallibacterium anatis]|uniref:Uncharacterized protein n=1 Tax=Gallibacterium anatis TaxID=750 RepID=A0A377H686_9PAST|nr:Uncharacterised protein [Gallibacterium anatis]
MKVSKPKPFYQIRAVKLRPSGRRYKAIAYNILK